MASVMLTAMPFAGHARPIRAVAGELVRRGHDVRVYTGRSYGPLFAEVGARPVPWGVAPDFDERDYAATFPRMRERKGFRQVLVNLEDLFLGTAPAQATDLLAEHAREPWDLLAGDPMALGTRFAAEHLRCRWATVSPVAVWLPGKGIPPTGLGLTAARGVAGRVRDAVLGTVTRAGTQALVRRYRHVRRDAGLPPDDATFAGIWYSPQLVVAAGSPGIDYPRTDLPGHIRFVGDLTTTARRSRSRHRPGGTRSSGPTSPWCTSPRARPTSTPETSSSPLSRPSPRRTCSSSSGWGTAPTPWASCPPTHAPPRCSPTRGSCRGPR